MELVNTRDGLIFSDGENSITVDFAKNAKRYKDANLRGELLVRAAKIKGQDDIKVLDATAGLGEDSFLLAAAGFRVEMFESDKVIAALLKDGLDRALKDEALREIAGRLKVYEEDSIAAMRSGKFDPDVVYLDPMFPERKKSALVKKKFQLLHLLEAPCVNGEEMLTAAFSTTAKKIVVKRPLKGEFLGGKKPDFSHEGKAIRYDVYLTNHK